MSGKTDRDRSHPWCSRPPSQTWAVVEEFLVQTICLFPRVAMIKCHKLGTLKHHKFMIYGGYKPQIKAPAGLGPSEVYKGHCFMPVSRLLLRASSPWYSLACRHVTLILAFIFTQFSFYIFLPTVIIRRPFILNQGLPYSKMTSS